MGRRHPHGKAALDQLLHPLDAPPRALLVMLELRHGETRHVDAVAERRVVGPRREPAAHRVSTEVDAPAHHLAVVGGHPGDRP